MFLQGKTVQEISESRKLKPATIESHLNDVWTAKNTQERDIKLLNITEDMIEEVKRVKTLLNEDPVKLKPIKENVKLKISYLQIKAILCFN
jgi:uncharacterized protein YpbB